MCGIKLNSKSVQDSFFGFMQIKKGVTEKHFNRNNANAVKMQP